MQTIWKPIPEARPKPTNEYCYAMGWTAVEKEQKHGQCRPHRHFVAHTGGAMGFSSILSIAPTHTEPNNCAPNVKSEQGGNSQPLVSADDKSSAVTTTTNTSANATLPKGIVVAIFVNLTDVGLSRTAEKIIEAFQENASDGWLQYLVCILNIECKYKIKNISGVCAVISISSFLYQ